MPRVAVFSVGDAGYLPYELVALNSIKRFNPACGYVAFVPAAGGQPGRGAWEAVADRLGIEIREIDFAACFRTRKPHAVWPLESLTWVAAPALLHRLGYTHSLYVDGDVLGLRRLDFGPLIDARKSIMGIANGPASRQLANTGHVERLLGRKLAVAHAATNAGVLFLDNRELVDVDFAARIAGLYDLFWPWGLSELSDQSLLALYIAAYDHELGILDPSWNLRLYPDPDGCNYGLLRRYYAGKEVPRIIHFLGGKPWTDLPTARALYSRYVKGIGLDLWNSARRARRAAANEWRRLAVETLGADAAAAVFGARVLRPVRTRIPGALHAWVLECILRHRARKAIRQGRLVRAA